MVGGKVVGVVRGPENTLLHVEDKPYGGSTDNCSVRCVERITQNHSIRGDAFKGLEGTPVTIEIGDSVWWQGPYVFWNSRHRRVVDYKEDVPLDKVGYSH